MLKTQFYLSLYINYTLRHLKALLLGNQITHDDKVFNAMLLWSQYKYENICSIKTRITHIEECICMYL